MNWNFQTDRPIYLQLKEQLTLLIISGHYPAGSRLPPVRDMAADAAVKPNTLQKALQELEREGLVYTQRTSGRFVSEDAKMIEHAKIELAEDQIDRFITKMAGIGFTVEETLALINKREKE